MKRRRSILAGLAIGATAGLGGAVAVVLTSDHEQHKALLAVGGGIVSAG